jgi:hypothetical protein
VLVIYAEGHRLTIIGDTIGFLAGFKDFLKVVALLVLCFGVPWIGWELMRVVPGRAVETPSPTYAELIAIVLTAITVALAVLAIVIAILAVWGYQSIKGEAAMAAEKTIKATVPALVGKYVTEESVSLLVTQAVARGYEQMAMRRARLYSDAYTPMEEETQEQSSLGTEYPKEGDAG